MLEPAAQNSPDAAQVERWTRLGQLLDSTPEVDFTAVAQVLAGERSYDELGDPEGELVLAVWQRRISQGIAEMDLGPELRRRGTPYFSADAEGNVIEHRPGEAPRRLPAPGD